MENPAEVKRAQLSAYIQQELSGEKAVRGVVAIGSVGAGTAGLGSDIDAFVFLDPLDLYALPAEFQWRQSEGSYHGIFVDVHDAIQFDFKRVSLQEWSRNGFDWPEPVRLELSLGWIAYDIDGQVASLIKRKTAYIDDVRQGRIDSAILRLDQLLGNGRVEEAWSRHGAAAAHDRLNDAYDQLLSGVFAYNRQWRPWRSREQSHIAQLGWLPSLLRERPADLVVPVTSSQDGYYERARRLGVCFITLIEQCQKDGLYGADPISEAFERCYDEPGRDWNIAEWVARHKSRVM